MYFFRVPKSISRKPATLPSQIAFRNLFRKQEEKRRRNLKPIKNDKSKMAKLLPGSHLFKLDVHLFSTSPNTVRYEYDQKPDPIYPCKIFESIKSAGQVSAGQVPPNSPKIDPLSCTETLPRFDGICCEELLTYFEPERIFKLSTHIARKRPRAELVDGLPVQRTDTLARDGWTRYQKQRMNERFHQSEQCQKLQEMDMDI